MALREEDARRKEMSHNIRQLFRAQLLMEKDVDYIIQDRKIVIIDENTGRPQPGRRFSDGLHQAIEAKENLSVQRETQTLATITSSLTSSRTHFLCVGIINTSRL